MVPDLGDFQCSLQWNLCSLCSVVAIKYQYHNNSDNNNETIHKTAITFYYLYLLTYQADYVQKKVFSVEK